MKIAGKSLRIVILRRVYDLVNHPTVQALLPKLIALKVNGYRREYPYGMLPFDNTDYMGDHLILCEESDDGLDPLMAYRISSVQACADFRIKFPVLEYVRVNCSREHLEATTQIYDRCSKQGRTLGYLGSGTVSTRAIENPELHRVSKDLFRAIFTLFNTYLDPVDEVISFGSLRFKVDRHLQFWGFKPISLDGQRLSDLELPSHYGEKATMFHLEGPCSKESIQFANQYMELWEQKIVLGDPTKARTLDLKLPQAA